MLHRSVPSAIVLTIVYFLVDLFMHSIASPFLEIGMLLAVFGGLILSIGWCEGARVWYKREREYKRLISEDHIA
jgi:hypothetical protein